MPDNPDRFLAATHRVENQPLPLENYNAYRSDQALQEGVARHGGAWADRELEQFGRWAGSAAAIELGVQANANKPELVTHDRYGRRLDEICFHPAYHRLMAASIEQQLHASPWLNPVAGAHVARAAKVYLQTQVEAAHICPITMTFASLPVIRRQPGLAAVWEPLVSACEYDGANRPYREKPGVTVGMAMTEKQGGSDVRANTTEAHPLERADGTALYELVGHKYFVSAPMCDAFLVLAHTAEGLSCFLMPRWRPDGERNAMQIQRLKNKMGNVANATAEVELRGALAWLIGEPGRGVATILEMVSLTRFDCMIGSTAGMRQAVVQANHHCRYRRAFGQRLIDQPLMQNVLADLNLEWEAALALTLRAARALDRRDAGEDHLVRMLTPIGKYWICKRTPAHACEAMECIGGSGVMEDCIMPRLFRESPINATWEGSGNVQCLDMLRAIQRDADTLEALLAEIRLARGGDKRLDRFAAELENQFASKQALEYRARDLVEKMALALQGALLVTAGNAAVADAFCAARLDGPNRSYLYGGLPGGVDVKALLARGAVDA